ncbi:hypothetical protein BH11MYX1_BH11MYX1_32830 [soil metagenome]
MAEPDEPDRATRDQLVGVLADLIERGGAARFLAVPVVPGTKMFPEPWAPTESGVMLLLRRLAMHAELGRAIVVEDRRAGAPPTERKPATRVELVAVSKTDAMFALGFIGRDDVVGTLAHEIGVAHAVINRPDRAGPYRSQEADVLEADSSDGARGSIATVYLGLGVVAANAAYQYYSWSGRFNGAYNPLEYQIMRATHIPMSSLAYLLAVQAVVCAEQSPPVGLEPPQRDEVLAWIKVLRDQRSELCERLGLASDAKTTERAAVAQFADAELIDEPEAATRKTAFRWRTHRGGVGIVAGAVFGVGVAMLIASRGASPWLVLGSASGGHVVGRRIRVPRCSACASVVPSGATRCETCGALLRGEIASLSERLDAEERLDSEAAD